MPTIRQLIPPILEPDEAVKLQTWVSLRHKRKLLAAIGDDGIFTLVVSYALKHASDFIDKYDIKSYDPNSFDDFVNFIRDGTHPRPVGDADVKHDSRAAKSVQHPDASASSKSGSTGKSSAGRSGFKAVKK